MAEYDYTLQVGANADAVFTEILGKYSDAQKKVKGDGIEIAFKCDDSEIEKMIAEIQRLHPEIGTSIKLNFDQAEIKKSMATLQKYIDKSMGGVDIGKDIRRQVKSGLTIKSDDINIDSKVKESFDGGSITSKRVKQVIEGISSGINRLDFSADDITLKQIQNTAAELEKLDLYYAKAKAKYSDIDLPDYSKELRNFYKDAGNYIANNAPNMANAISGQYEEAVRNFKEVIKRLGVKSDGIAASASVDVVPDINPSEFISIIESRLEGHDVKVNVVPDVNVSSFKSKLESELEGINIGIGVDGTKGSTKSGNTIGSTIRQWNEADAIMSANNNPSGERIAAINTKTGYITNAYVSDRIDSITDFVVGSVIDSATESVNAIIHSHPTDTAAFSRSDLDVAYEHIGDGIERIYTKTASEIASFDFSKLKVDYKDIADELESKRNRYSQQYMAELTEQNFTYGNLREEYSGKRLQSTISVNIRKANRDALSDMGVSGFSSDDVRSLESELINKIVSSVNSMPDNAVVKGTTLITDEINQFINDYVNKLFSTLSAKNPALDKTKLSDMINNYMGDIDNVLSQDVLDKYLSTDNKQLASQKALRSALADIIDNVDEVYSVMDISSFISKYDTKSGGSSSVSIPVEPDTDGFNEKVQEKVNSGENVKVNVEPDVNAAEFGTELESKLKEAKIDVGAYTENETTSEMAASNTIAEQTKSVKELEVELEKLAFLYKISFRENPEFDFEFDKNYKIAKNLQDILDNIYRVDPSYSVDNLIASYQEQFDKATSAATEFDNVLKEIRKGTGKWSYNKILDNPDEFADDLNSVADEYYSAKNTPGFDEKALLNIEARFNSMLSSQSKLLDNGFDDIFEDINKKLSESTSRLQDLFWDSMANGGNMSSKEELSSIVKNRLGFSYDVDDTFNIDKLRGILDLLHNIDNIKKTASTDTLVSNEQKKIEQYLTHAKELENRLKNTSDDEKQSDPEWVNNQYKFISEYINKAEEAKAKIAELKNEMYAMQKISSDDIKNGYSVPNYDDFMKFTRNNDSGIENFRAEIERELSSSPIKVPVTPDTDGFVNSIQDEVNAAGSVKVKISAEKTEREADASDSENLSGLDTALTNTTNKVDSKTAAFEKEGQVVSGVVSGEISDLSSLDGWIDSLTKDVDALSESLGRLSGINLDNIKSLSVDGGFSDQVEKLKNTLNNANFENLRDLNESIGNLNISESSANNLQNFANAILTLKSNLNNFSADSKEVLNSIKQLVSQADALKDLATVLSASKKDVNNAKKAGNQDNSFDGEKEVNSYIATLKKWENAKKRAKSSGSKQYELDAEEFKKSLDTQWKALEDAHKNQKLDDSLFNRAGEYKDAIESDVNGLGSTVEKQKSYVDKYISTLTKMESAEKKFKSSGNSRYHMDSEEYSQDANKMWNQIQKAFDDGDLSQELYDRAKNYQGAINANIGNIRSGLSVLVDKNDFTDAISGYKSLIENAERYYNLLNKQRQGKSLTAGEDDDLRMLTQQFKDATAQAGIFSKAMTANLDQGDLKAFADKFETTFRNAGENSAKTVSLYYRNILSDLEGDEAGRPKAYENDVNELRSKIESLEALLPIDIMDDNSVANAKKASREVDDMISKLKNSNQYNFATESQKNNLYGQIISWEQNNSAAAGSFGAALNDLKQQLRSPELTGAGLDELEGKFVKLKNDAIEAGKTGMSFGEKLSNKVKELGTYLLTFVGFDEVINVLRQAFDIVVDINAQQVELAKVSETSSTRLEQSFENSIKTAKELKASISDTISATADWSRVGYDIKESEELAKASILYKNVGDGISIDEANESLVSTLQGFQMEASEVMDIVDSFNEVANRTPIDSAGIGEALQRSAASFHAANTDLNESIALIVGANSVLQDPSRVGNMWKTVSMRIRGAKLELEEAGEDTDGMVESTSELRDLVKGLTGFDIMEDEDTFKNMKDIIVGIGKEWNNLTDLEQSGLLNKLAGKTQANALAAALENYELIEKAYDIAENSEGSALKEQETWSKSLEARIQGFTTALQELAAVSLDSDVLGGIIDAGTKLIEIFSTLIDKLGVLTPLIGTLGGAAATKFGFGKQIVVQNAPLCKIA